MTNRKQCDAFQTSSGLQGDTHGCGGCMELTNEKKYVQPFFRKRELMTVFPPS